MLDARPRMGLLWVNPHTNIVVSDPKLDSAAKLRKYFGGDLDAALKDWGKLNDSPDALAKAKRIVHEVAARERADIFEVFVVERTRIYVAVVMTNDLNHGSAFVTAGFVDFRCALPGANRVAEKNLWRRRL